METNLFTILFQRGRRDHCRGRMGEDIDKGREGLGEGDLHRGGIHRLGFSNILVEVVALQPALFIAGAVKVGLHRLGVKVGAVLELDAAAQLNGVDQPVVRDGIALGQHVF